MSPGWEDKMVDMGNVAGNPVARNVSAASPRESKAEEARRKWSRHLQQEE